MTLPASYATVADVIGRYPPIGSVSAITSAHVAEAIGVEQAMIDARLASQYPTAVPFSPVPGLIHAIATDLSALRIIQTRAIRQGDEDKGKWLEPFMRSVKLLEQLAAGSMSLVTASGTVLGGTTQGEVWSNVSPVSTPAFLGQEFYEVEEPDAYWRP